MKSKYFSHLIMGRRVSSEINKKVVLYERKRHTARRVASTCSAALSPGGGGTPIQPDKGVPHPIMPGGTPY